jgi:uncharacterized phage protein (TIGR02218 family)
VKNIPLQMRNHLAQEVLTTCTLLKVVCSGSFAGRVIGFTSLDESVDYSDGIDSVHYLRDNGFYPAAYESTADMTADNTDVAGYASEAGITIREVRAGLLDNAEVTIYRVNYMDLSMGHEVIGFGKTGRAKVNGQKWVVAFKSLVRLLDQTINPIWSLTCRAQYGDARCKKAFEWFPGSVASVGSDSLRIFAPSGLTQSADYFEPGLLQWLTGDNADDEMEVESYLPTRIQLALTMPYPIKAGDTFRIRRDCDKTATTCKARNNLLNFRGEHLTPVAQAGLMVPGAYVRTRT